MAQEEKIPVEKTIAKEEMPPVEKKITHEEDIPVGKDEEKEEKPQTVYKDKGTEEKVQTVEKEKGKEERVEVEETKALPTEEDLQARMRRMGLGPPPGKKLLVLSANGLLFDAVHDTDLSFRVTRPRRPDFVFKRKYVFKRPFCDDFLRFCFDRFHVAIWSSMMMKNVEGPLRGVLGPLFSRLVFFWDQSTSRKTKFMTLEKKNKALFVKELNKVWASYPEFSAHNTLLMDESPHRALLNPPNTAIFPSPFDVSLTLDDELNPGGELRKFLEGLAKEDEDVPSYVAKHRVGQEPINEEHKDWTFYSWVIKSVSV